MNNLEIYSNQKYICLDIDSKHCNNKKQQSSKYFIELNKKKKEFEKTQQRGFLSEFQTKMMSEKDLTPTLIINKL